MKQRKLPVTDLLPVCTLLLVVIFFSIFSGGKILTPHNMSSVVDQSLTVMIGGMGMIFVLCHGGIDLAIGSLACLASFIAAMTAMPYGIVPVFLAAIATGVVSGFLTGLIAAKFKVPSFMVTVALQTGIREIANYLSTTSGILLASTELQKFNKLSVKLPFVLILLAVMWYVFEYTRLGKYSRAIGENELCCKISGINVVKIKMIDFMICGAIAGIAGIFMMARTGGASNMLGKGFELRVIMALFLGSVPVVGGMDSKMFKVVIGALTVIILENGLSVSGISGGLYQLIEGIMMIAMCVLTAYVKKKVSLRDEKELLKLNEAKTEEA